MKEQDIQKKLKKFLESKGAYVVKVIRATKGGVPDLLACLNGEFIGIEVKKPDTLNRVTELQKYNLDLISKAGGKSYVISSVEELKNKLNL